jgi:hypothetical protein
VTLPTAASTIADGDAGGAATITAPDPGNTSFRSTCLSLCAMSLFEYGLIVFDVMPRFRFGTGRQLYHKLGGEDQTGSHRIRRGGGSCPRRRIARLSGSSSEISRPELARRLPHTDNLHFTPHLCWSRLLNDNDNVLSDFLVRVWSLITFVS